jgi:hypothetical protein
LGSPRLSNLGGAAARGSTAHANHGRASGRRVHPHLSAGQSRQPVLAFPFSALIITPRSSHVPQRLTRRAVTFNDVPLAEESADDRACPFCGATIKAVARKCRHCRQLLGEPDSPGIFRHGKKLVVSRTAHLPPRCIKTGEPTDRYLIRDVRWHHPLVYLFLFMGVFPYFIAAHFLQEKQRLRVPLSPGPIRRRRLGITFAWIATVGGIVAMIVGADRLDSRGTYGGAILVGGVIAVVCGLIAAVICPHPVTASYIDDDHLWLKGAGQPYLAILPEWPGK